MENPRISQRNAIARVVAQHRAALLVAAVALPLPAGAQTLEEVIVTAQKREASLQDTSLSVQVLGSDQLRELNVSNFGDAVKYLPTVSFTATRPGIAQVYMRGIATGGDGNHSASSPSVGIYLDEQPITTINEILHLHMYDMARIETLAGPQGTLFGASSQAGTIRFITNKPVNDEFQASYDLAYENIEEGDDGYTAEGMVNIPMGDSAALRLVGWHSQSAGYIDNVRSSIHFKGADITIDNEKLVEDDFNEAESSGARAQLKIDLGENWTITPGIVYQEMDTDGVFDHDPDDLDELETAEFYDTFYDEEWYQASLTVEGSIGGLDLVYAGAYLDRDRDSQYDYTGFAEYYDSYLYLPYCYLYDAAGDCTDPSQFVDQDESWSRESHEIRLQDQEGSLRWIVGAFYQDAEHDFDLQWVAPSASSADYSLIPGGHTVWQTHQTRKDEEKAVFGEVSYDITDRLTILGGLRYYEYDNSLFGFNGWIGRCTGFYDENGKFVEDQDNGTLQFPCYDTGVLDDTTDGDDTLGKVNISYDLSRDKMIYFTWSEGYRPGGVNRAQEGAPYEEDFVTNWEIGWKTGWFDSGMRWNGAIYYMDWEDIQYNSLSFGLGVPLTIINNAGDAEVYGFETDLDWAITNEWLLRLSGSYNDAETKDSIQTTETEYILKGTALPYIPEIQASAILRYETQWGDYDTFAQVAWAYRDDFHTDLRPEWSTDVDSYNAGDLSFGIARNSWHAEMFITNVTDERGETDNVDPYPAFYVPVDTYYGVIKPRTIGIRFGQTF